jgi:hypothetical protein
MIERFNFYDVYGYFLPGLVFLTALWLPFALLKHTWPTSELSSAVAAVVFAYVAGHILQTFGHGALPSKMMRDSQARKRFPSDIFLDSDDPTFSDEFKSELGTIIKDAFGLDVAAGIPSERLDDSITHRRQDAFFRCRAVLLKQEIAAYTEQFEGLYSLMRGLAIAFGLDFAYIAGWGLSYFRNRYSEAATAPSIFVSLVAVTALTAVLQFAPRSWKRPPFAEQANLLILAIFLLALGYHFAVTNASTLQQSVLWVISLAALLLSIRCFGAYKYFAQQFAQAVWRDFAAHMLTLTHD